MHLLQVLVNQVIIFGFATLLGNFWYQIQVQILSKTLLWTLSKWNYHSGTAPCRVEELYTTLAYCIFYAVTAPIWI